MNDPPRVLIVDDEPRNRVLLAAILAPEGYATLSASDGERCLSILDAHDVDLVLLDMMMPVLDGVETCRRIRAHARGEELPVVFVTAYGDRDARVRAKEAGADEFLTKPVDETELIVRVRNLLKMKALRDAREKSRSGLSRELARRTEDLLQADRLATLGTLASAVGHELNNLGTVFNLALDQVEAAAAVGASAPAEAREALRRVFDAISLHGSQLLSLGRPGPDRAELLDLDEVLGAVLDVLRSIGRLQGLRVEVSISDDLPCALANRTRVEQVLVNLITNALDALSEETGRPKELAIAAELTDRGRISITVRDSGPGMSQETLDRVFETYFTTKAQGRGTGLGMPIVRQIVESYGGHITVTSAVGRGTVCAFDLPSV